MRVRGGSVAVLGGVLGLAAACATYSVPAPKRFGFPKDHAFLGDQLPDRAFDKLGQVRAKADFTSLDPDRDESKLCQNAFNQAVVSLVKLAQQQGADAVVDVRSVVFLVDGRQETYARAECSDDGQEGQAAVQGIAIRWKREPSPRPSPSSSRG